MLFEKFKFYLGNGNKNSKRLLLLDASWAIYYIIVVGDDNVNVTPITRVSCLQVGSTATAFLVELESV